MTYAERVRAVSDSLGDQAALCHWSIVVVGINEGCDNFYRDGTLRSTLFTDGSVVRYVGNVPEVV